MDRFWGIDKDRIAAKQLGLSEDYTIFMMANEMEYHDDMGEVARELELEYGNMYPTEVVAELIEKSERVKLPGRLQLVGMDKGDEDKGQAVYGVIDFAEEGEECHETS